MEYDEPKPTVEDLLEAGEVTLLIAQEKSGKSTLMRQLGLDVCRGDRFLGRFKTAEGPVLHIDYENRPWHIKKNLIGLNNGGTPMPANFHIRYFLRLADRDVGFDGARFERLTELVEQYQPRLLVVDPLRLALGRTDLGKDKEITDLIVKAQLIVGSLTNTTLVLVHHLRKAESDACPLHVDPKEWVSRIYGGQALLATAEGIIGLEERKDGLFTLATVQRNLPGIVLRLQREVGGIRFELCSEDVILADIFTPTQKDVWHKLGAEFTRSDAAKAAESIGASKGVADNMIKNAVKAGLVRQPQLRGPFHKLRVDPVQTEPSAELPEHHKRWPWVLFLTGWRKRSVLGLPRSARHNGWLYLPGEQTKNKEPVRFPDEGALAAVLDEQEAYVRQVERQTGQVIAWVFCYPDGAPIQFPEQFWRKAAKAPGLPELTIHDLRRSAVRQAELSGIDRDVFKDMAGIKTDSIYSRYNIVDEKRLRDAAAKLRVSSEPAKRKVVPLD